MIRFGKPLNSEGFSYSIKALFELKTQYTYLRSFYSAQFLSFWGIGTFNFRQMVIPTHPDIFGTRGRFPHGFQSSNIWLIWTICGEKNSGVTNIQFVLFSFDNAVIDTTFGPSLAFICPLPDLIFRQERGDATFSIFRIGALKKDLINDAPKIL